MSLSNTVLALGLAGLIFVASPARGASMGQQAATSSAANADDTTLKSRVAANLRRRMRRWRRATSTSTSMRAS